MIAFVLAALVSAASAPDDLVRVQDAMHLYDRQHAVIDREAGTQQAADLVTRLLNDSTNLQQAAPQSYAADWNDALHQEVLLDTQAIDDLAAGKRRALDAKSKGLYETFLSSSVDGKWIPVAVYIPANVRPHAPLAIMLHGSGESETNFLGAPYFRRLADRTGTILVAPYARGIASFAGVAQNDVYDVLHAAQAAFSVDDKRTYLVGYSMGGFSVFRLGPLYRWSAVMDISGAIADNLVGHVAFQWRSTPVYVVTGSKDAVVPAMYPEHTAQVLQAVGVPAGLYEQPNGEHWLRTLLPALTNAWNDMHAGIVHAR